jgi:hypothetical protein
LISRDERGKSGDCFGLIEPLKEVFEMSYKTSSVRTLQCGGRNAWYSQFRSTMLVNAWSPIIKRTTRPSILLGHDINVIADMLERKVAYNMQYLYNNCDDEPFLDAFKLELARMQHALSGIRVDQAR